MAKLGKKYAESVKLLEKNRQYEVAEAMDLVCKTSKAKFDETVEVHVRLGVDSRQADQQVRGAVVLPNGTGKKIRVLAFVKGDNVQKALDAGADYAGGQEYIDKILQENWLEFDVAVATPDMMASIGKIARTLGPKGLMPSPKAGTVTPDVAKAVAEVKAGKIEYRLDKANIIHVPVGKVSFTEEQLTENVTAVMEAINKARPSAVKGVFLKSITVASTMGPGVKLNTQKLIG